MTRETVEIPVLSDVVRRLKIPLSLVTRGNGMIFVSGMPPFDLVTGQLVGGDIERQATACMEAVKFSLETAGSSLDKALMFRIYAANAGFYHKINGVYARFFAENPPARTFVTVASWPMEFDIEIECIAMA